MKFLQNPNSLKVLFQTLFCCALLTGVCFAQEIASEPAPNSKLTGIALPAKAERVTDKNVLPQFIEQLDGLFDKKKPQEPEVIGWDKDKGYTPQTANRFIEQIAQSLKAAGYEYELKEAGTVEGATLKLIVAVKGKSGETVMGLWYVMADTLFLAWAKTLTMPTLPASAQRGRVLIEGEPALTQGVVDAFFIALGRTLDVPVSSEIKPKLQKMLTMIWQEKDDASINTIVRLLALDDLAGQKGTDKDVAHLYIRTMVIKDANHPNASEAARSLRQLYDAAHPPIATSKNNIAPLTSEAIRAFVEFVSFALKEMPDGIGAGELEKEYQDWLADWALELYQKGDAQQQEMLTELPFSWMAIEKSWQTMSDAERNQLRQKFAQRFADEARKVKLHRITIQSYETINAEAARIKKLREQNALTPADIERMAQAEEATARALRAEGDERSLSLARQFEGFAKQMRSEANEMRRPVTVPERPAVSTSSCVGACAQRKLGLLNEFKSRFMY